MTAVNDAPVATNDSEALTEDDSFTSITVLDDDTDADGDSLTVSAISYSGPEPQPLTRITPESTTHQPPTSMAQIPSPTPCLTVPPQTPGRSPSP